MFFFSLIFAIKYNLKLYCVSFVRLDKAYLDADGAWRRVFKLGRVWQWQILIHTWFYCWADQKCHCTRTYSYEPDRHVREERMRIRKRKKKQKTLQRIVAELNPVSWWSVTVTDVRQQFLLFSQLCRSCCHRLEDNKTSDGCFLLDDKTFRI